MLHLYIGAEEFARRFLQVVKAHNVGGMIQQYWQAVEKGQYQGLAGGFTNVMRRDVLPAIADALGCAYQPEQQVNRDDDGVGRLDAVLFDRTTNEAMVAWEHEGDIPGSVHEIGNLRAHAAPLKVLVTYPRPSRADDVREYLAAYTAECMLVQPAVHAAGTYVVVFGMPDGEWQIYTYEVPQFERLADA